MSLFTKQKPTQRFWKKKQKKLMATKGKSDRGGINYEFGINRYTLRHNGLPRWHSGKESANTGDVGLILKSERYPGVGNGNPFSLPGKSHGQQSLAGCSAWCCKDSDTTA